MLKKMRMLTVAILCMSAMNARAAKVSQPVITDKTLVAWVTVDNLKQQGSGVFTLTQWDCFDAIVLGELQRGKWMAGSDYHFRTQREQNDYPLETAKPDEMIQIAIAYEGNWIRIFRNGKLYAEYQTGKQIFDFSKGDATFGFGKRYHQEGWFAGEIEEVRLYDVALDEETISQLQANIVSDPKPLGMWTFEDGTISDTMGRFPDGILEPGDKITNGRLRPGTSRLVTLDATKWRPEKVQAGFYTPKQVGRMWDTWMYYHNGKYYMYYMASGGHYLALSDDGVYWQEHGNLYKGGKSAHWVGTGHIWKSPDFENNGLWIMNYSEGVKNWQDIMFVASTDLVNWKKAGEKYRFSWNGKYSQWYKQTRWDCIDAIQLEDGTMLGYFTALPIQENFNHRVCGFGAARSRDGLAWEALPPPEGDVDGEFGGIQKIKDRYYITVGGGAIGVGEKPQGPFYRQKKNFHAVNSAHTYFVRFFHNAPGGPLMNHFFRDPPVITALVKDIEVDGEGILRFKWWKDNEKLKKKRLPVELVDSKATKSMILLKHNLDLSRTTVIEGQVRLTDGADNADKRGIFFDDLNGKKGYCVLFGNGKAELGRMKADGSEAIMERFIDREIELGSNLQFRVVIKNDVMETYLNDYLMTLSRLESTGKMGFICGSDKDAYENIQVWQAPASTELN